MGLFLVTLTIIIGIVIGTLLHKLYTGSINVSTETRQYNYNHHRNNYENYHREQASPIYQRPKQIPPQEYPVQRNYTQNKIDAQRQMPPPRQRPSSYFSPKNNGVVGIQNLGNTCYLNACLQCLYSLKQFSFKFLSQHSQNSKPFILSIYSLFLGLKNLKNVDPSNLIQIMSKKFPIFTQNDCMECLLYMLNSIEEEEGFSYNFKFATFPYDCHENLVFPSLPNTLINNSFRSLYLKIYSCSQCSFKEAKYEINFCIMRERDEDFCGNIQFKPLVFNNYECKMCLNRVDVCINQFAVYFSKCLVVYLSRFDINNNLNDNCVKFAEEIELNQLYESPIVRYRLISILCFTGDTNGGHYYSAMRVNGNWVVCNDSQTYVTKHLEMIQKEAMMLFYEGYNN